MSYDDWIVHRRLWSCVLCRRLLADPAGCPYCKATWEVLS